MIYVGTRKQRDELCDYIDELDTEIYSTDKKRCSEKKLAELFAKRDHAKAVMTRGFGIVKLPRK